MAYVIEKKIPVAMQERIFRETQQARDSASTGYGLDDDDFLEYIQNSYTRCVVDYVAGNYLMELCTGVEYEVLRNRYLFYFNHGCYLFYTDGGFYPDELIFFKKARQPIDQLESCQTELNKVFRAGGRNLFGWTDSPRAHLYPTISTILTKEW